MKIRDNISVTLSAFVDKEDNAVCISASVQVDASYSLEEIQRMPYHSGVQANSLVELLQAELEYKLYVPLRWKLQELLKGQS